MTEDTASTPEKDGAYHTYTTHRIPWYVPVLWIGFALLFAWYVLRYVIPSARSYF